MLSCFPGIGNCELFRDRQVAQELGCSIIELGEPSFWTTLDGERNPRFIHDYIDALKARLGEPGVVIVSAREEVRTWLIEHGVVFTLVYPTPERQAEYIRAMVDRGLLFVAEFLRHGWSELVGSCDRQDGCAHYVLGRGCFLRCCDVADLRQAFRLGPVGNNLMADGLQTLY